MEKIVGRTVSEQDQQLAAADVHAFHLYLAWYPTTQAATVEDRQEEVIGSIEASKNYKKNRRFKENH